ncbi:MAG: hypothetical protein FWD71_14600 [Oscillospiraceae bacterium]|nr:hypothetical protein [Oscillospiraceae bacterium]
MSWKYYDERDSVQQNLYNKDVSPAAISGNKISKSFWAAAWNKNLENYAYYFRHQKRFRRFGRMVFDIKIEEGLVKAVIMGSRGSLNDAFDVKITVQKMPQDKWDNIIAEVGSKISNVGDLATGKFPRDLAEKLLNQESGLFPSLKEIKLNCSCHKQVEICTHSVVALYGIGMRFDDDPLLFFKLRGIPFEKLLKKTVDEKISNMIKNAEKPSDRIITDEDISDIFNIDVNKK